MKNVTLVMEYTQRMVYKTTIQLPDEKGYDASGVSRGIEECVRAISGVPNVDAESVRFYIEN